MHLKINTKITIIIVNVRLFSVINHLCYLKIMSMTWCHNQKHFYFTFIIHNKKKIWIKNKWITCMLPIITRYLNVNYIQLKTSFECHFSWFINTFDIYHSINKYNSHAVFNIKALILCFYFLNMLIKDIYFLSSTQYGDKLSFILIIYYTIYCSY